MAEQHLNRRQPHVDFDIDEPDANANRRAGRPGANRNAISRTARSIRTAAPPYRWECPCQEPPVLLATYGPDGRMNIKVRDRYWHLYGFGQVQAICPRCAGEHILDLRELHDTIDHLALDAEQGGLHHH